MKQDGHLGILSATNKPVHHDPWCELTILASIYVNDALVIDTNTAPQEQNTSLQRDREAVLLAHDRNPYVWLRQPQPPKHVVVP